MGVVSTLRNRGFIYQTTHDEQELDHYFSTPRTYYVGFDPTADSLHVGSLVPIMAMAHLQAAGHRPIAIIGGGTARVGDPSGKTEMRKMLDDGTIDANELGIAEQLGRYLKIDGSAGLVRNNKDWLVPMGYIQFLRDVGVHFSVNRMLTAESVRSRLETGLSFIEFNYMLLQAYDFYVLLRDEGCTVQMGGQDQWGNIVAGIDLCRRMGLEEQAYGITFPLITNSSGAKFGKSEQGNIWLDASRTSPLDFYQFWRNVEDSDVRRFLLLFTFLPIDEIDDICRRNVNRGKEILGFEATRITHGSAFAHEAYATAVTRFGSADPNGEVPTTSEITSVAVKQSVSMPELTISSTDAQSLTWTQLLVKAELASSNSDARRLVRGGGARWDDHVIEDSESLVSSRFSSEDRFILRAGKKRFMAIRIAKC